MIENQFSEQSAFTLDLPLFEFKAEYAICEYDKAMNNDQCIKPDLLTKLNIKKNIQIDFYTVEIKKPGGNIYNQYGSDFIKVHREMKSIIDAQIRIGVDNPVAYSLLIESKSCILI